MHRSSSSTRPLIFTCGVTNGLQTKFDRVSHFPELIQKVTKEFLYLGIYAKIDGVFIC